MYTLTRLSRRQIEQYAEREKKKLKFGFGLIIPGNILFCIVGILWVMKNYPKNTILALLFFGVLTGIFGTWALVYCVRRAINSLNLLEEGKGQYTRIENIDIYDEIEFVDIDGNCVRKEFSGDSYKRHQGDDVYVIYIAETERWYMEKEIS